MNQNQWQLNGQQQQPLFQNLQPLQGFVPPENPPGYVPLDPTPPNFCSPQLGQQPNDNIAFNSSINEYSLPPTNINIQPPMNSFPPPPPEVSIPPPPPFDNAQPPQLDNIPAPSAFDNNPPPQLDAMPPPPAQIFDNLPPPPPAQIFDNPPPPPPQLDNLPPPPPAQIFDNPPPPPPAQIFDNPPPPPPQLDNLPPPPPQVLDNAPQQSSSPISASELSAAMKQETVEVKVVAHPKINVTRAKYTFPPYTKQSNFEPTLIMNYDTSQGNLRDFILRAPAGATVLISPGIYNCEIQVVNPIHLKANGAVTLKGVGTGPVVKISSSFCFLEGLVIEQLETKIGPAVSVTEGFARILKCNINSPVLSAVAIEGKQTLVEIEACMLHKSRNPIVMVSDNAQLVVYQTKIKRGQSHGIYCSGHTVTYIHDSIVSKNKASGVYLVDSASLKMERTGIKSNENCGVEILSNGIVSLIKCFVTKNKNGPGVATSNRCAMSAIESNFVSNDSAAIKASGGSLIYLNKNIFHEAEKNSLIYVCEGARVRSEYDTYQGKCLAAIAVFNQGHFESSNINVQSITGAGSLCYDQGILVLNDSTFKQVSTVAIQVRNFGRLEMSNSKVTECIGNYGISFTSGSTGFLNHCEIFKNNQVGMEIQGVSDLTIFDCEFYDNRNSGLCVRDTVDCTIANSKFYGNYHVGLEILGLSSKPKVLNCTINKNNNGVHISNNADVLVKGCKITGNPQIGFGIKNSHAVVSKSEIYENGQAAISLSDSAKAKFSECFIRDNYNIGCQATGKDTHIKLENCAFSNHIKGVSLFAIQSATIRCVKCNFESSLQAHAEIRDNAKLSVKACAFSGSGTGVGIQVHHDGFVKMNDSVVRDETKMAVMVGEKGKFTGKSSNFQNCGTCGFYISPYAEVALNRCAIINNGTSGIQMTGGELSINECTIRDHKSNGIYVAKGAVLKESNTSFHNNGSINIYNA